MDVKSDILDISLLLKQLKEANQHMGKIANSIGHISKQTRILALNSAIEAARAGEAGRGFRVIADEIKKFADQSSDAANESDGLIQGIQQKADAVIAVRTADLAYDTMDKIDRNLFERNCDVQAWATFDKIKNCLRTGAAAEKSAATLFLKRIVDIYEVYFDIYLADKNGKMLATACNQSLVGIDVSPKEWFVKTMENKDVYVTDMYFSSTIGGHSVAYSCPVREDNGEILGVLSTRFNWNFIYDIIDSARIDPSSDIFVINNTGLVIASKKRDGILSQNLSSLKAVKKAISGETFGYTIESDGDGMRIYGFAHTRGYNAYKGKDWSVIISERI